MVDHAKHLAAMHWRGKLQPTFTLPLTQPLPMTSSACRRVIEHFLEHGSSTHTPQGGTLWALLDYLQRSRTPYTLHSHPEHGYVVEKLKLDLP